MTLYDIIMREGAPKKEHSFTKDDWAALGSGNITDESVINAMLSESYEGLVDE